MLIGEGAGIEWKGEIAVQVNGVGKSYGQAGSVERVLDNISFSIGRGEVVSLLGESGCGKSTLLNVIGGFESADEGEVLVSGAPVTRPGRQCVMLFQDYALLPWRSVLANVELALQPLRLTRREQRERAIFYIELVGLGNKAEAFPHQLSGGMKQRTAIARALAMKPQLLLMDEPFAALDTFTRYTLQDELLNIQQQEGVTVLLVTHDIDEAVYLSNRVLIMKPSPGKIGNEIKIESSRPLDRGHADFQHYRKRILEQFKFSGEREPEEFSI